MAKTVNHTRMSAEQAHAALEQVETQLDAHRATCADCAAEHLRDRRGFAIWRMTCEPGRAMERVRLSLEHRCYYLARKAANAEMQKG